MHTPVNRRHVRLVNFMDHRLHSYLEHKDLGELHRQAAARRLSARHTFLPDLAYFTKEQAVRLALTHVQFPPRFVLEALSPATARRDTRPKFATYGLPDVLVYWILDSENLERSFYRRGGELFLVFAVGADRIDSVSIAARSFHLARCLTTAWRGMRGLCWQRSWSVGQEGSG
jgi:Uma2 family endonuclease